MEEPPTRTELSCIAADKQVTQEGNVVKLTAAYSPSLQHSERFCGITGDTNPIHKEHPKYKQAISPGFLQSSTAEILIREAIRHIGLNPKDYPSSFSHSEMKSPAVTGCQYRFEVELDSSSLKSSAKLFDKKNNIIYSLKREDSKEASTLFFPVNLLRVHLGDFTGEKALEFGQLVGSISPESNLYALSASSSVVCDAVNKGKLHLPDDIVALYTSQKTYTDSSSTLDLKKGISLELFLSDLEEFGKLSEKGKSLDMRILARDCKGRFIYSLCAPLSFQKSRLIDLMIRKALR